MRVGRNDPCPCGSGKKYKKCCLAGAGPTKTTPHTEIALRGLHKAMEGRTFNSLEELQSFTDNHFQQKNQAPLKDFLGLSSEEMFRFLHYPFVSPQLISFPAVLDEPPEAPIMTLFNLMVEAIGEEGLKATAKGNLPRTFVREAALAYWGEEKYRERTQYRGINREDDLHVLTTTRLIAKMADLILLRKKRFDLTRKCRDLLSKHGPGGVYPLLFKTYAQKFNWAYLDGFPDFGIIQQSFAFTLWVLSHYGDVARRLEFYEEIFLRAFPRIVNEVGEEDFLPPKRMARLSYTLRTLRQFVRFMGLGTVEQVGNQGLYKPVYEVKKLPLLDQVVQFHLTERDWPSVDDLGLGGNLSERAGTKGRAMAPAEKGGPVSKGMAYQIKVTLRDTNPPIWRRILVAGEATFWDLHGNYYFRFEPDPGTYTVDVEAFSGLFQNSVSGVVLQNYTVGGVYDPRELYYDIARQNMIKSHMDLHPDELKWTMSRITIPDATFNYVDSTTGKRQFPLPAADTFPWTANNPSDYSAATNNHAGNQLNDAFFTRLVAFCDRFNDNNDPNGYKVILCLFDSWYFGDKPESVVIQNNPWAKLANDENMAFDSVLHVMPDDGNAVSDAMEDFLDKLAETLYSIGPDVYIEFNNETRMDTSVITPSDSWLKAWQDYLFKQLRDPVYGGHSEVSIHMMVNAQNGTPTSPSTNDYVEECWCHHDSVSDLSIVGIRNFYISGHQLTNPSTIDFGLCAVTPGDCGSGNQRGMFFTEGWPNAGASQNPHRDDYVYYALENGYNVALGVNQRYRDVGMFWGSGEYTPNDCNVVNTGIYNAVVQALQ